MIVNRVPSKLIDGFFNGEATTLSPCTCGREDCSTSMVRYVKTGKLCWEQMKEHWRLPVDVSIDDLKEVVAIKAVYDMLLNSLNLDDLKSGNALHLSSTSILDALEDEEIKSLLAENLALIVVGVDRFVDRLSDHFSGRNPLT